MIVIFWLIFFVAKIFEARADLLSAIVIGKPDKLAMALQKGIGDLKGVVMGYSHGFPGIPTHHYISG